MEKKLPISAIVVSCNEGHLLKKCIESASFCNEIILIDLNSNDDTPEIGKKMADSVITYSKVPIIEYIHPKVHDNVRNNWVLLLDPDEEITLKLQAKIIDLFSSDLNNIGIIELPWQFYFFGKKLHGTIWGGTEKKKKSIIHRQRIIWSPTVHKGIALKSKFEKNSLQWEKDCFIIHKWFYSFPSFLEKHQRYLKHEGKVRFEAGEKYSEKTHLFETLKAFKNSFFTQKGYKDGSVGLALSVFWMWYVFMSYKSLKLYQRNINEATL